MTRKVEIGNATLYCGDCREILEDIRDAHAVVTDPPYELGFMGKAWDRSGIAFSQDVWSRCLAALRPGGHLLAFGGSRTFHRIACAIEDSGFDIRDTVMWLYGSGFPKSLDVSKAIDKAAGAERAVVGTHHRHGGGSATSGSMSGPLGTSSVLPLTAPATDAANTWQGWGTALKPAHEPVIVARKPLEGTVAENVQRYGTGAINVGACRVPTSESLNGGAYAKTGTERHDGDENWRYRRNGDAGEYTQPPGRWPANVIHDGSEEVLEAFAAFGEKTSGKPIGKRTGTSGDTGIYGSDACRAGSDVTGYGDSGSAARFFYAAKASRKDRGEGNTHPTVKPQALMEYLVRLVTPPGGVVLDPFMGSGSTGVACAKLGTRFVGIELLPEHFDIACRRLERAHARGSLFEMAG